VIGEEFFEAAAAGDFLFERGIPPEVIDIDGDADERRVEFLGHVVGLAEGVHGGAVAGIHRMQRFDGEFDVGGLAIGEEGGDAVADLLASFG